VRVLGITPQPVAKVDAADTAPMTVSIEGRYFAIRKFLRLLRSSADITADKVHASGRLFAVDSIAFTSGTAEPGRSSPIEATLSVTAFAYSQPVALPSTTPDGTPTGAGAAAASP
jgi:hypothetical protein